MDKIQSTNMTDCGATAKFPNECLNRPRARFLESAGRWRSNPAAGDMSSAVTLRAGNNIKSWLSLVVLIVYGTCLWPGAGGASYCEPVKIPMCDTMPYNTTRMPNLLYHSTQQNAILVAEQFQQLVETNCSHVLTFYLCAMFAPICTVDFRMDPVPPCKNVCQAARRGCEPVMNHYNVSWPPELDCRNLPVYDTGVCVMPEAIVSAKPSNESSVSILPTPVPSLPPDCKCQTNLKHLRRKFYTAQRFDYVIDASLESTTGAGAGHVITTVYVHNVLKKSSVKVTKKQEMKLWTTGACHCQAFLQRNRYVIMGYEDKTNKQLLLDDQSAVFLWNSSHIKRIRKWNKKLNRRVNRRVNNNNRNRSKDSRRSTPSPRVRQKPHRRNNSIRKRKQERRKRRKRKRGRGRNGNRVRRHVAKTDAYG